MSDQMDRCPNCGEPLARQATFCYQCRWRRGESLTPRKPRPETSAAFQGLRSPPPAGSRVPATKKPGPGTGRVVPRAPAPVEPEPEPTPEVEPEPEPHIREFPGMPVEQPETVRSPAVPAAQPHVSDDELIVVDETHAYPRAARITPLGALVGIVVAVGLISAVAGAGVRILTRQTATPRVSKIDVQRTVGPAGGILRFSGGSINFPPGSVDRDRQITVIRFDPSKTQELKTQAKALYGFGPSGVRFSSPITISFDVPDASRPAEVVVVVDGSARTLEATPNADGTALELKTSDFTFTETGG